MARAIRQIDHVNLISDDPAGTAAMLARRSGMAGRTLAIGRRFDRRRAAAGAGARRRAGLARRSLTSVRRAPSIGKCRLTVRGH